MDARNVVSLLELLAGEDGAARSDLEDEMLADACVTHDGAVFSQWLHTYEMDAVTLSSILTAVAKTFPEFVVYSSIDSDIIVIARRARIVAS